MILDVNAEGFSGFVRQVRPRLLRQAFVLCGDRQEAEDLVQETLLRVYRAWWRLARHEELAGYAGKALTRTFLNEQRRARRRYEVSTATVRENADPHDELAVRESRQTLLGVLRRLNPVERAVIVLRYWDGLSVNATAGLLSIPPGTVTSHSHRAMAMLRAALLEGGEARGAV